MQTEDWKNLEVHLQIEQGGYLNIGMKINLWFKLWNLLKSGRLGGGEWLLGVNKEQIVLMMHVTFGLYSFG